MKDNRDKQMAQLAGWTWDLNGYAGKCRSITPTI